MTMLRKLFWTQTFLQATNASRTDTQRHRHSPGRIDTHTSPLLLVLSPAGASFLCRSARNLSARASFVSLRRVAAALWGAASLSLSCCGLYRDSLSRLRLHSEWSSVSRIEFGSIDPNGRLFMCDSMHETAATPSVPLATAVVAMCVWVFSKTMYLDRQRYTVLWPFTISRPNTRTKTIFPH